MPSAVDPAIPVAGTPTTASVRANFAAVKTEIEALQDAYDAIVASFANRAVIAADYPNGTQMGGGPTLTWNTRPLNTIVNNGGFLVSLANNQFVLPAGRFRLKAEFMSFAQGHSRLRLYDFTAAAVLDQSINTQIVSGSNDCITFRLESDILLGVETTLAYQQITQANNTTYGWGMPLSVDAGPERFAQVTIQKLPS
jgi:hypothetical protein